MTALGGPRLSRPGEGATASGTQVQRRLSVAERRSPSPSFGHPGKKELARLQRESYLKIYKAYILRAP